MKRRQILLDFTSLLDVIMIILFFFIIFGKIESDKMIEDIDAQKEQIAADKAEIELLLSDAKEQRELSNKLLAEAQIVMDEANVADERSGDNVGGITEFARNKNIKFCLSMAPDGKSWTIIVQKEGNSISIDKADSVLISNMLKQIFAKSGYTYDDTILIEMIYNGNEIGTYSAYQTIEKALSEITKDYKHCFCSKTDLSDFSE